MRTKSMKFHRDLSLHEYDIIAITETWLNNNLSSSEFFDDFYHVYRVDRCPISSGLGRGGGVLIAIRADLCSSIVSLDLSDNLIEQICVKIKFARDKSVFILVSYIPPISNIDVYEKHLRNLVDISDRANYNDEILYLGDFNLGNITWVNDNNVLLPSNLKSDIDLLFTSTLLSHGFNQINSVLNDGNKILDLVFISAELNASCEECLAPLSIKTFHHNALIVDFTFYIFEMQLQEVSFVRDYSNYDIMEVNNHISNIDW